MQRPRVASILSVDRRKEKRKEGKKAIGESISDAVVLNGELLIVFNRSSERFDRKKNLRPGEIFQCLKFN